MAEMALPATALLAPVDSKTNTTPAPETERVIESFEVSGPHANVAEQEDIPPDGGYGWVCTACVLLVNASTWGVNSAYGVFLAYFLSHSTFSGASRLEYALIGGLSISQSLFISPLIGLCNEKLGTRISLLIGAMLVSVSLLASSFTTRIWQLFLSQGVCFGYGLGFLYIPASTVLPQWFDKKRSLSMGIASSGAGFGGLVYNLVAGAAIQGLGWRWTYRILAISTAVVNVTCALLLKDRNKMVKPKKQGFNVREFGHISVVLVILWGIFTELGYIVLLYSLPDYAISIGLSANQGAVVGAVLNVGLGVGRPIIGLLSDRFGRIDTATGMSPPATALCGIFVLSLWVPAHSYAVLLLFALAIGSVTGIFWGTVAPVTAEVVGLQRLPATFGMLVLPLVIPTVFAEPIALGLAASYGYLTAKIFVGCMFLAGAASTFALRSWKLVEGEGWRSPVTAGD
ncbi:major facilitator superfamily domain-containing protein [Neohortaea acidophila]|uniref:Major facilitator superfamily domain-containing protein n=1 Tax=Neohortaea acidophila TaxID=245834 RepID=A0A6A6PUG5_9PEZI|nr:major facilitator superfamily domain-containing protein [Neohortaea acidophila]KAF2483545.1 major facilitator superfamily domain-containing protein [Neohortaea acidophila]